MNTEYLPPANEPAAISIPGKQEIATRLEMVRIQCFGCTKEVGMEGTREAAFRLLEFQDWKIGREILCPECVKKAARKFFSRYSE